MFGTIRKLVNLAIALLIANAFYHFVPPYVRYQQFKDAVRQVALFAKEAPEGDLAQRVLTLADEHHIPIGRDNVEVRREQNTVYIDVSWVQTIDFAPFYSYPWQFDVNASAMQITGR